MTDDYICLECGNVFSYEDVCEYNEGYGEHFRVSPCCYSAIGWASRCKDCEEYFPEDEMYDGRCKTCDMKHTGELLQCELCDEWVNYEEIENGICDKCSGKIVQFKKYASKFVQVAH